MRSLYTGQNVICDLSQAGKMTGTEKLSHLFLLLVTWRDLSPYYRLTWLLSRKSLSS